MTSPAKRPAIHRPNDPSPHPSVPDDLAVRLRNLGSRIRKNVTEGYATRPSPQPSPSKPADIFQSAKDTLHDVFHAQPSTPPVSPRKRSRSDSDDDADGFHSDMDITDDELPTLSDKLDASRPIKPLKGANRIQPSTPNAYSNAKQQ